MPKTKALIEGLQILEKYRKKADGYSVSAEHDEIFAHATDKPLNPTDLARMVKLGWRQPDTDFGDDEETGGDFGVKHYDVTNNWAFGT